VRRQALPLPAWMGRHRRSVDGIDRRVQPSTGPSKPWRAPSSRRPPSAATMPVPSPGRAVRASPGSHSLTSSKRKQLRSGSAVCTDTDVQSHSSSRKGARTRIWLGARPTEAPLSVVRTGEERFRGGERASGAVHTDTDAGRHPDRREAVVQQRAGRSICAGRGVLPADLVSAQTLPHVSFFQPFVY
jgi:hypothetical protein